MKKIMSAIFALFLLATYASAQKTPSFAAYKVKVGSKVSKQPNLATNKNARMYRTNLRNAAKDGVNFAGHFVLATWGCGTSCMESGIIDARTGKVFFPEVLQGVGAGFCDLPDETETLDYKPDSRLLILSGFKGGAQNDANPGCGIYYLEWTGTNFRQVGYVAKKATN
jgi:hypothetical protein